MDDKFVYKITSMMRKRKALTFSAVRNDLKCSCADAFDAITELVRLGMLEYTDGGVFKVLFDDEKARVFKCAHGAYYVHRSENELKNIENELNAFDINVLVKLQENCGSDRKTLESEFNKDKLEESLKKMTSLGIVVCSEDKNVYALTINHKQFEEVKSVVIIREADEIAKEYGVDTEDSETVEKTEPVDKSPKNSNTDKTASQTELFSEDKESEGNETDELGELVDNVELIDDIIASLSSTKKKPNKKN